MLKVFQRNKLSAEEKSFLRKDRLLLILSGILTGISFTPFPFPFTLFLFIAFIPYFLVLEKRKSLLEINRASYLMFFTLSLITIYWVGSWQSKADPFLMIGGGVLIFFYPVVLLINSTLFYLSQKIFSKEKSFWLFPIIWVTGEYLLTLTDLKFPWLILGHGLAKFTAFIQIADVVGAFGLSLIVLYINVLLFKAIKYYSSDRKLFFRYVTISLLVFMFFFIYGIIKLNRKDEKNEKYLKVGVVQPNLDPWDKWELGGLDDILKNYIELSEECTKLNAKIIIWPETALPVYLLSGTYSDIVDSIYSFLRKNNVYLLTGMPDYIVHYNNPPTDAKLSKSGNFYYSTYNSILLLNPNSYEIQRYGKMQLVPLGEKVPFVDALPFLANWFKWGVGLSGWNVGKDTTVFKLKIDNDSVRVAGLVCYESVFPDFVTHFVKKGAQFITVVTNDSWYGNSSGPYQHKEFAALRAVENRRAVVRSANGGISCLINKFGITEFETKMFTRTSFVVDVPLSDELTFYTKYPFIIPILSSAFSIWIIGINFLLWLKRKFKFDK
ncbi:Apolipoprotein N-acyltransferase [Ignavibacterium album JCM 16511]|uniref:Apolipoprotein N-acyltransferase n=1 Tax=Ignavibacterium album (strain DSM 19864 / JCM 16511 / NBRC 101810 / Mat9-16) TaxID=945713 RepID=I0ALV6_IGNAJ|nr:apolipoprotein N-acyltransferase [Ignavibacterium album]AFH49963.1 Apolipoprotein N-acyltransferase [Ignavibacterium album JCM 16511]